MRLRILPSMSTVQEDYHAYLEGVYPGSKWAVNPISGGYINKTIRVTKFSGKSDADSLILKHARPTFGEGDEFAASRLRDRYDDETRHRQSHILIMHIGH